MLPGYAERDCLAADLRRREALQAVLNRKALLTAAPVAGERGPIAAAANRSASAATRPRLLARLDAHLRPATAAAKA